MKSVTANIAGVGAVKNIARLFEEIGIYLFCTRYHPDVLLACIEKIQADATLNGQLPDIN